jgi:methionyl-tRNA synthetase
MPRLYVTTTPSRADALELVLADVLARHHRVHGDRVRFVTGAAAPREPLVLSSTDVMDTNGSRHRAGADLLGRACTGDLLSRHADRLHDLITTGELRVEPAASRAEVLGVIAAGPADVPVEPWWDTLACYVTSLGYGSDGPYYQRWWCDSDRRIHVIGGDALTAHALYWPALLLSAGLPLPTDILVRPTVTVDTADLVGRYGSDALRWWLLRETPPAADVIAHANRDLAGGVGNLVDRVTTMVHRYRDGKPPAAEPDPDAEPLLTVCRTASDHVHRALTAFDFGQAAAAVLRIVEEADRYVQRTRPWELTGRRRDAVLAALLTACRALANQLTPFVPALGVRIAEQCFALSGSLAQPRVLFPKLTATRAATRRAAPA